MWAQIVSMILGLAVMVAPAVFDFGQTAANNNYIVGPLVITFAMTAITDVGRNLRWWNIAGGFWLIVAPFLLDFTSTETWINVIMGAAIAGLSCIRGKVTQRFGGGWRSLFQKNPLHVQEARKVSDAE